MRLLLDTHVALWSLVQSRKLLPAIRRVVAEAQPVVSIASIWEASIKHGSGRLADAGQFPQQIAAAGFEVLEIGIDHAWHVRTLPRLHGDPFARLIVAQAMLEGLTLVTHDRRLAEYGVPIIAA